MTEKSQEIPKDKDYVIRPQTPEEKERVESAEDIPEYRVQVKLTEAQQERLSEQSFLEFKALDDERTANGLPKKWTERDHQYDGDIKENKRLLFNLHVHQSKIKVNAIARALNEAFLPDSDSIVEVTPRPEMATNKNGFEVCEKQTQFIDYVMDEEVKPENAIKMIGKCAAKKFVGIGKINWSYRREKRRREESYEGKNVIVGMVNGQPVIDNEGLKTFLSTYPDAMEEQRNYVERLAKEQKINIVVEYKDTVNNNATLEYIKLENFYVRNACNYNEGLRTEHLIAERRTFSYFELMKKKQDGEFENVEKLWDSSSKDGDKGQSKDYMTKEYDVMEFTTYFKFNPEDDEEVKIKCWFGEENKVYLGCTMFPWYAFDTDYIGFWLELNEYGFYGDARSVMFDLRDSNIAQDALFSLFLHGTYARNIMTPIVKEGSEIEQFFLDGDVYEGKPLPVDELTQDVSKELGFVEWPDLDPNAFMAGISFAQRIDGNVTGISDSFSTGRNDPTDPNAPASKTIALLQQSGINIKDYIKTFLPSFNIFTTCMMQMYYQMSQEGRKFRIRRKSEGVVGENPFKDITRDEMIAKTNIQARAASFVFDKASEKNDAAIGIGYVSKSSYAAQIPEVQYQSLRIALSSLGPRWKNLVDSYLPNPEKFKQQQAEIAKKAVGEVFNEAVKAKKTTGVMPSITPEQIIEIVTQAQAGAYNPALAEAAAGGA